MTNIPDDLKYTKTHEWVRLEEDGVVTVGITDHAQSELTDITFIELPELNRDVEAGDDVAVVESVKQASEIYSPVAGSVLEINEQAAEDCGIVNSDAFGDGWLFKLAGVDPKDLEGLLSPEDYKEMIG